jgi:hypothetical protein
MRMFEKLGREVVNLVEGGELSHPGLIRGADRIRQLDVQILAVEERVRAEEAAKKNLDDEGEGL